MKLSQATPTESKKILIFGPPKAGKTYLFGTLASHFKLILFDLENGFETLKNSISPEHQDNVEIIRIPDTRSFPIAIETMLKVIRGGPVKICHEHGKVGCSVCAKESPNAFDLICLNDLDPKEYVIGVDSLTQLTNSAISHITRGKPDDYKLDYDDWGNLGKLMDTFLSHVQNAKFNIVCISHETEVEMVDGKQKIVPTAGTRNFSRNTAKYFGEVVYCEVKNRKHIAASSTAYANNILTGSRSATSLENASETSLLYLFGIGEKPISVSGTIENGEGNVGGSTKNSSGLEALKARLKGT